MKNTLKSFRFLFTALVIAGLAMTLSFTTKAEDQPLDKMAQLESQVQSLLQFKQQVENYNPNVVPTIDDLKNVDQAPQQAGGDGTKFPPSNICTSDYLEWPSSDTYKKSDEWPVENVYLPVNTISDQYIDLNGDGLVDRLVGYRPSGGLINCVYLNNGRGWDLVHKCYGKANNNIWTFYGDCALTE